MTLFDNEAKEQPLYLNMLDMQKQIELSGHSDSKNTEGLIYDHQNLKLYLEANW